VTTGAIANQLDAPTWTADPCQRGSDGCVEAA